MAKLYGSLNNRILEGQKGVTPEVGMGVTLLMYSDRKAGTIIKTTRKTFTFQIDKATRTDKNGMSESQSYTFEADPNGQTLVARQRKNGTWRTPTSGGVMLGYRDQYHDFSF